ncbi:MAG TPA: APC family permease [Draconibacterium sp.]|nr:APC family permease [Draconibacterium sp.]
MSEDYKKDSLSLIGAISMGTGVMIGTGIFALLGQVAELSGRLFPIAFVVGAIISGFSAYSYIKLSNAFPSAGGIGMYLVKEHGKSTFAAFAALLMAFSMLINESLVARTFGIYTLQLFQVENKDFWIPTLGVGLILLAFTVNIYGNKLIERSSIAMAVLKVAGLALLAVAGLWASNFTFQEALPTSLPEKPAFNFIGALALTILAYKGFTTITNSGDEINKPHKNIGRAIIIAISICLVLYFGIAVSVNSSLSIDEIIKARDYSLAEAARPVFGQYGVIITVVIAIIATVSGIIANIFAVSRMTAMLTKMKLIPHSHLGMSDRIQKHMLVYVAAIAIVLTILFDLSRIASMGAIFYLIMDIGIHYGLYKKLRAKIDFNPTVVISAIVLDTIVLLGFLWTKIKQDTIIVLISFGVMLIIYFGEKYFLSHKKQQDN